MVRLDAFDDLRGLASRFNPSCRLIELPAVRGQVRATDLEESLDRDADEMFREDHSLVLASAQGDVPFEARAVLRREDADQAFQVRRSHRIRCFDVSSTPALHAAQDVRILARVRVEHPAPGYL